MEPQGHGTRGLKGPAEASALRAPSERRPLQSQTDLQSRTIVLGVRPTYFQGKRRVWTSDECAICIALFVPVSTSVTFKQSSSLFFQEFPNNLAFHAKQARMSQCGWDSARLRVRRPSLATSPSAISAPQTQPWKQHESGVSSGTKSSTF